MENHYKRIPLNTDGEFIGNPYRIKGPRIFVNISFPKHGKTLSMINVKGLLIGDTHKETDNFSFCKNYVKLNESNPTKPYYILPDGTYISSGVVEVVEELYRANQMKKFAELEIRLAKGKSLDEYKAIYQEMCSLLNEMPFPIFAIDTVTHLQDINCKMALYDYNNHVKPENRSRNIKRVDRFGGATFIRRNFSGMKEYIETRAAPFIIWNSHVKERKLVYDKNPEDIGVVDMDLEGGVSPRTFTSKAAAVCVTYLKPDGVYMDFQKRTETDIGARCAHLSNKVIRIAETQIDTEKEPVTHWDLIYPELKF